MSNKSHASVVRDQFGVRADAYVTSAVHAQGEDLQQLAVIIGARPTARVLDLGCGGGHVAFRLAPQVGQVVAYDLSTDMLRAVTAEAGKRGLGNIVTECGMAETLPFADASFDVVASRYSAHHWRDLAAGLKEARRVLKKGGVAVFMDVISPGAALTDTYLQAVELLRDPSHVRDYSLDEWRHAATAAGFVPGEATCRRLPLDFTSWIQRMATPDNHAQVIRSLQARMGDEVARHFAIQADGSFTVDTMTLVAMD
ncbi:MAG TPA: class I SAM-dependent methyltransferase [Patescibacteria group bacterium]|nr:class I SAM-dependent methyltransferase [Patescibacteria group bacterium]